MAKQKRDFLWFLWALITLVALLHLFRAVFNLPMSIGTWVVPIWLSWTAVVVIGFLSYKLFKFLNK